MYSITKQQYSSDLWPLSLKAKRNCIGDKSLKIIKLIGASLSEPHSLVHGSSSSSAMHYGAFVRCTYVHGTFLTVI